MSGKRSDFAYYSAFILVLFALIADAVVGDQSLIRVVVLPMIAVAFLILGKLMWAMDSALRRLEDELFRTKNVPPRDSSTRM